jgi:hypothetical protein
MGPIALFDKSFLQSLTVDESVWFDHFFLAVVSPFFYVETLADLGKSLGGGRTPEDEVRIIAEKEKGSSPLLALSDRDSPGALRGIGLESSLESPED